MQVNLFKRHRTQTILLFFLVAFLMSACVTTSFKSSPDLTLRRETQKILLMPLDVQLFTLTAGGILKPEAKWTMDAKKHVEDAIREKMRQMDEELILYDQKEKQIQLMKLHEAVGRSILVHQYIPAFKLPEKGDRFDWSLGPEARLLKEKNESDYALFVYLRDSYASAGRVAAFIVAAAFGASIPMGQQVGFASLVDLETGNVVWFNRLFQGAGDLRTHDAAANSVKILLSDFPK